MAMTITVEIDRMRLRAFHGLLPQERLVGNMFEVSVSVSYPAEPGADITPDSTVCYAELANMVKKRMAEPSGLIETVALDLREAIVKRWPQVTSGSVRVSKVTPPVSVQLHSASVTVSW